MIPSSRLYGLLLGGMAIAILLAATLGARPAPWTVAIGLLVYDGLILLVGGVDCFRGKRRRAEVRRVELQRLSIHRDNPVTLSVEARYPTRLMIDDHYPNEFAAHPPQIRLVLEADTFHDATYTVHPTQRGDYQWGDIALRQLGPWGLAWHSWKINQPQTVSVYPDLLGLRSLTLRLTLQSAGSIRQARQRGIGTEFAELKDYGTGDDPRLIDWKATARRDRPLVRVLEPEHEQTLIVLLDRGRLMTAQVESISRFDWGINATLSLALAGITRGDRVGIGVFDRHMTTWIPPERGQRHFAKIMEQLAPLQPVLLEPDYFGAATTLVNQQTRRALVVMITDIVDVTASAELLSAMIHLSPRYLPCCVALRDPEVDQQAHAVTSTLMSTYSRAVALDVLTQRQLALAQLKQRGVLVLDAPAHHMSNQLVDRYLHLKARNLL